MVEITGIPCSGKSTKFNLFKIQLHKKIFFEIFWPFFSFFYLFFNFKIFIYILNNSLFSGGSFFKRINLYRNSYKKIFFRHFPGTLPYIDEGISHIPFNFDFTKLSDFYKFIDVFRSFLSNTHIIIIVTDKKLVTERLIFRGHTRLKIEFENNPNHFVEHFTSIESLYLEVMPSFVSSFTIINGDV